MLVTGASLGIGLEIARALAAEGCRVVFAARSLERLQAAAAACGPGALAVQLDVTSDGSVASAVEHVVSRFGRIDVVVNNAGSGGGMARWRDSDAGAMRALFDVHVFGTERVMRAVVPLMARQGQGTIVNFSSTLGYVPMPGTSAYNAAKASVVMLSRTLRSELQPAGIDVRIFSPPHTSTESGKEMPLDLPKIFEPEWVAQRFVQFLAGGRSEALPGGNGTIVLMQRLWPGLAGRIMQRIGFGALQRVEAKRLPAAAATASGAALP